MATQRQAMPVPLPYKPSFAYNPAAQQALFWLTNWDQHPPSLPQTINILRNTEWGIVLRGQAKGNWEEHKEPESHLRHYRCSVCSGQISDKFATWVALTLCIDLKTISLSL